MKTLLLIILVFMCAIRLEAQTVADIYPELLGTMPEHYFYDGKIEDALSAPSSKPDMEQLVKGLRFMDPISEDQSCIIIYRRGKEIAFVWFHHARALGASMWPDQVFKIGPDYLELVKPLSITNQRLWETEIRASRWVWHYDAAGHMTSKQVYRGTGQSWCLIQPPALEQTR